MNEPNPNWVSAPYEESGIADIDMVWQIIDNFSRQSKVISLALSIEKTDYGLFKYHLKQN